MSLYHGTIFAANAANWCSRLLAYPPCFSVRFSALVTEERI